MFPGQLGGLWLGCPKHNTTWKVTYRGESQVECYRRFKAKKKKSTLKFNYKFSNFLGQGTCSFFGLIASIPKQTIPPTPAGAEITRRRPVRANQQRPSLVSSDLSVRGQAGQLLISGPFFFF